MPTEADSSDSNCEDCEIELDSHVFTRLTQVVRAQYLKFLERQLEENVRTWQEEYEPHPSREKESIEISIHECAKFLEDLAIKEAILTQLYQRAMVKTIAAVKQNTKDKTLVQQMSEFLKCNGQARTTSTATQTLLFEDPEKSSSLKKNASTTTQTVDYCATKAIQTEELKDVPEKVPSLTLDERLDLFQAQLKKGQIDQSLRLENSNLKSREHIEKQSSKRRRLNSHNRPYLTNQSLLSSPAPLIWHSPTPPPPPPPLPQAAPHTVSIIISGEPKSNEFDIQLEDDEIAQELDKIFTEQEPDLDEIFGIVTRAPSNCNKSIENKSQKTPNLRIDSGSDTNYQIPTSKAITNLATSTNTTVASNSNEQKFPAPITDLRYSLWPCECFMQKRKLSTTLNRLIEEDIRWHDILQWQFSVLFGDESVDDFAPCSPSIELDEVLKNSCMRRISPWVVRHLMKPLNDGLIGNRFLFKKLAKKLAHRIIMENQYPDEYVIKSVIENYFCIHRAILTAEDLDDIKMMSISNYDE